MERKTTYLEYFTCKYKEIAWYYPSISWYTLLILRSELTTNKNAFCKNTFTPSFE